MQMQNQQRLNRQLQNSLNTINMNDNINMKNAAEHVNDSLYHYENRQGQVVRVPNH
jgi:TATA-box binding protein (TBP) (component of TFIID and TFIIIB)